MTMRHRLAALGFLLLAAWAPHGVGTIGGGSAPVVNPQTITLSVPLANNGAVGTASATNSPTSWTLVASSCATCYQISNSGVITGAANAANVVTESDTLTVTATNASGTSPQQTITINAYVDGYVGRPTIASANLPNLLNGEAVRPPWKVAGVDYGVGIPDAKIATLKDPTTISISGVTVNSGTGTITCTAPNVVLDNYDMSAYQVTPASGCSNITITNSKIKALLMNAASGGGMTVTNNNFDQSTSGLTSFLGYTGGGATAPYLIEYNVFFHSNQHILEAEASTNSLVFKFNLIQDSGANNPASHVNYLQMSGTINGVVWNFNTVSQQHVSAGGEGIQWVDCCSGTSTMNAPDGSYNTMVTTNNGACALSYLWHISNQTGGGTTTITNGTMTSNYMDDTGTLGGPCGGHSIGGGFLYAGTAPGVTLSVNKAMQNGATIP